MSHERIPITKLCIKCGNECTKAQFSNRQWRAQQPSCRLCVSAAAAMVEEEETKTTFEQHHEQKKKTKTCAQCSRECEKDQFPKKQWKERRPLCRLCFELTKISDEQTRQCKECTLVLPRSQYNIDQWGKGDEALCHGCRELLGQKILASFDTTDDTKTLPDGTMVCLSHSLELCDACMMDFTLPNRFVRMRLLLGRDLTNAEYEEQIRVFQQEENIPNSNRKICILDGQAVCPRSGRKLRCPCNEVTYCSKDCQLHHWTIHKMTCKVHHLAKAKKKKEADRKARASALPAHGLTEEQVNFVRMEAFLAENNPGGKHSIEECSWQLGEHPIVIGGGSIRMSINGQEFVKGDVHKIYMDAKGVVWDGSPRFGMSDYVQQKAPFDWIAMARQGKSQRLKDFERNVERELKRSSDS